MSAGSFTDNPDNRKEVPAQEKPKRLTQLSTGGQILWADFSDGTSHQVHPVVHDEVVELGCVKTTRKALRLIQEAIEKEDKFQAENAKRLMEKVSKGRKKVKA